MKIFKIISLCVCYLRKSHKKNISNYIKALFIDVVSMNYTCNKRNAFFLPIQLTVYK